MDQSIFPVDKVSLKVRGISKKFGSLTAVDDLSFDVRKGEVFGFLGPNGAGKTTTINMLCGLIKPDSGDILLNGHRINESGSIKNTIGVCPQENIIWPKLSCIEQLEFMGRMYGLDARQSKERGSELLKFLGLDVKKKVIAAKLSGGMKRRLCLALALINDPEILILDEPEAGLDPQSRILVRNYIKNLAREKTIILTTHNMDEAERMSDRVAIIDFGKLLKIDTVENLKKSIGEGDILRIKVELNEINQFKELKTMLRHKDRSISFSKDETGGSGVLIIKEKNLIEKITVITDKLKQKGIKTNGISMSENTLEDVFISLTGRKLRS